MDIAEKTMKSETVYRCPVFSVTKDQVLLPDGRTADRDKIIHHGGSGVLPITPTGQVLLVEQYRYGIGQATLEIPAGKLERGEDPETAARRELNEEIGAKEQALISLGKIAVSPAYDSEIIYIYLAENVTPGVQSLDDDEFLNVRCVEMDQAMEMIENGIITDAKTQIALLRYQQFYR